MVLEIKSSPDTSVLFQFLSLWPCLSYLTAGPVLLRVQTLWLGPCTTPAGGSKCLSEQKQQVSYTL